MAGELQRIDVYCDTVPRTSAATEQIGPFTLFVGRSGRSFYARPTARPTVPQSTPADRDDFDGFFPGSESSGSRRHSNGSTRSIRNWPPLPDRRDSPCNCCR